MVAGTLFAAAAMFRGQHWQLLPAEKAQIAQAMADTVGAMPDGGAKKTAELMQTFAAPLALFGALGTAIGSRVILEQQHLAALRAQAQSEARARAQVQAAQQQQQESNSVRTQPQPQPGSGTDPYAGDRVGTPQDVLSVAPDGRASNPLPTA